MRKSPVIKLDRRNKQLVRRLEAKLREYEEKQDLYKAPEQQPFQPAFYKQHILRRLLDSGEVKTWDLSREIHEKYGYADSARYSNSCAVIADYVATGGKRCLRGGLPEV